jgi:4-hydroxy-tetrahydrodipicolinate synthase
MFKTIPNGVYPTMLTPFTEDNRIDYNAVEQLLNWYSERNVDGIFAICQSSEIFYLSFEEKLELIRFIMNHKPKEITVVASGHTSDNLKTQIEEAKAYIQTGIDAYVFISNRFAKEDEDDSIFLRNIEYVANSLPEISLGIYECPYPYKRLMKPEILNTLASMQSSFRFLKDTCCNLDIIKEKLEALKGTQFKIFNISSVSFQWLNARCTL